MTKLIQSKELTKLRTEESVGRYVARLMHCRSDVDGKSGVRKDCLFLPRNFGPLWVSHIAQDNGLLFNAPEEVNSPYICWPMNIGWACPRVTRERDDIQFHYWQSVSPQKIRGKVRFTGRKNIACYYGNLDRHGNFVSSVMYAAWIGSRWKTAPLVRYDEKFMENVRDTGMGIMERFLDKGDDDIGSMAAAGQSVALTFRYEWGAQFSFPGSPKVIVPTTPRGILELFNDREKPEGKDRRDALKHWVSEHVRKKKANSFQHVIAHLRGQLKFQWRGYDVEIKPAKFDLEKIEASKK